MKRFLVLLLTLLLLLGGVVAFGLFTAMRDPVVHRMTVHMRDWPANAAPMRVVLISDLHVAGPETPPSRLARIVGQVNALKPDLVLIAGDVEQERTVTTRIYDAAEATAPLAGLRARYGVLAVLGNHDYTDAGKTDLPPWLAKMGITVLRNSAVRRGPLTIAGADDLYHGKFQGDRLNRAARALPGPTVVLSHTPDIAPLLPKRYPLVLAGHTHCGQIAPPWIGPITASSRYGLRFVCGLIREPGRDVIVTGGIGTSGVPLRIGAVPDFWLLTFDRARR
ncbi:metallophosphoesterase [Sphingomonas sp. TDK1]|uniref:metallophosphoesterase n=1 Tax=Sphingomonas sp. TDK1 TaxID=453247 RepID=UPI0007D99E3E|nr:metallophosphoesterase [Sphingomonas sp. TDK1]OAN66218.1 phosphohydrolase [Sphingomonas sp. TDK1]